MESTINGPVDTAMRTLGCLVSHRDRSLSLDTLRLLDVAVVATTRLGGPPDVHYGNPISFAPHSFREDHVVRSLALLEHHGVAERVGDEWRFVPSSFEMDGVDDMIETRYGWRLRVASDWLRDRRDEQGAPAFERELMGHVDADVAMGVGAPPNDRFATYLRQLACDQERLEAIEWMAARLAAMDRGPMPGERGMRETMHLASSEHAKAAREESELDALVACRSSEATPIV